MFKTASTEKCQLDFFRLSVSCRFLVFKTWIFIWIKKTACHINPLHSFTRHASFCSAAGKGSISHSSVLSRNIPSNRGWLWHSTEAHRLWPQRQPLTPKNNAAHLKSPRSCSNTSRAQDSFHLLFPLLKYKCASNLSLLVSSLFCQYGPWAECGPVAH